MSANRELAGEGKGKPSLAKSLKELLASKKSQTEQTAAIVELLRETSFLRHLTESFADTYPNPNLITAVCDNLKFDFLESRHDIIGEQEPSQDWLAYVIQGGVEFCKMTLQHTRNVKSDANHCAKLAAQSIGRPKKAQNEEEKIEILRDKRSAHLISLFEFELVHSRMFQRVESHISRNKVHKERFVEKRERLNSEYLIKKMNLTRNTNAHRENYFLNMINWKRGQSKSQKCAKGNTLKLALGSGSAKPKGLCPHAENKPQKSYTSKEKLFLTTLQKFREGDLIGRLFHDDPLLEDGTFYCEPGSVIMTIRKSQIYKILSILNKDAVSAIKPLILSAFSFDYNLSVSREANYFLASFKVTL